MNKDLRETQKMQIFNKNIDFNESGIGYLNTRHKTPTHICDMQLIPDGVCPPKNTEVAT